MHNVCFLPANYSYNASGGVREWTGIYILYQTAEQVSRAKGQYVELGATTKSAFYNGLLCQRIKNKYLIITIDWAEF